MKTILVFIRVLKKKLGRKNYAITAVFNYFSKANLNHFFISTKFFSYFFSKIFPYIKILPLWSRFLRV